jgi:hypothetical protein
MSLADLNAKMVKVENKKGFVREKIRNRKKSGTVTRTRAAANKLLEVVKNGPSEDVRSMLDLITADDRKLIIQRLRENLSATRKQWNMVTKQWDYEPDARIQMDAIKQAMNYLLGQPTMAVQVNAKFSELRDDVEAFKSPAAQDFLRRLAAGQLQKSGGEKLVENAREIEPATEVQQLTDS